jgi:hypothetical protein
LKEGVSTMLGSTGCEPVVVGKLADDSIVTTARVESIAPKSFSAKLPKRTGWQPVLPRRAESRALERPMGSHVNANRVFDNE